MACSPGQYCASPGLVAPTGNCSARYYCSANASTDSPTDGVTGDECPIGHFCPVGTASPIPCEPGTYTDTPLNEACLICTQSYYCTQGSNPQSCPAGFYCPEGTGHVWGACPVGTFSSATGLYNITQCMQCRGGLYCSQPNATSETGPCDAGFFCRSGSDAQRPSGLTQGDAGPCPEGHYCPQQTQDPYPCPPGFFSNVTGLTIDAECQECLAGHYCDIPGLWYPAGLCDEGHYCAQRSNTSSPSLTTLTGGPCPEGTFCKAGSVSPEPCLAGTYNPQEAQANCSDCPPGYYCTTGSSNITDCPTGE